MRQNIYATSAIVLKRRNHGEADRVLTVLSRDQGKFSCLAKGVRKLQSKKRGHIEVFTHIQAQLVTGYTWDILTETQGLAGFSEMRKDLKKVASAYRLAEVVDRLVPEREPHPEVFDWLLKAYWYLDEQENPNWEQLYRGFGLQMIKHLGYWPDEAQPPVNMAAYIESLMERPLRTEQLWEVVR